MRVNNYFKKREERPTPASVYSWRIYAVGMVAAWAAVMIGYDSAFIGTSIGLTSFRSELGVLDISAADWATTSANIVTVYQAGAIVGSLFAYIAANWLGRKWNLTLCGAFGVLGAGITCATSASTGLASIYAGRVILGFSVGIGCAVTPLYLSEISPPAIRGRMVGLYEACWQIGGIVGFFINYGITRHIGPSHQQWIIPFYIQLIPSGIFLLGTPWLIKESPRWLESRGRRDEALKNLAWLRKLDASHPYILEEMAEIESSNVKDRESVGTGFFAPARKMLTTPTYLKRLLICSTLFLWQNASGINAVNYYSTTFFKSLGLDADTSLLATGLFGVVKTIGATFCGFFLIDNFGRRSTLIMASIVGGLAMIIIGSYNAARDPANTLTPGTHTAGSNAMIFLFYLWALFYSFGWNLIPWTVNSEIMPAGALRALGSTSGAASNWLWTIAVARGAPNMFLSMGHSGFGVFLFFGFMQLVGIIYLVLLLPETKNVPLEHMDRLWNDPHSWSANKRLMADLQAEHAAMRDSKGSSQDVLDVDAKDDDVAKV